MTLRKYISIIFTLLAMGVQAQIGYQVVVIDQAKNEPKANAQVTASITISDNAGKTICRENVSGTTDEFGILSMQIGNASTFANTDWAKLPLWVTATVDGVTISKTQILSVPIAEHAKHTGTLTKEILKGKTWYCKANKSYFLKFSDSNASHYYSHSSDDKSSGPYFIYGNTVIMYNDKDGDVDMVFVYDSDTNSLYGITNKHYIYK